MATVDAFLKLENIKGESSDSKHKEEIEIESWSWGMSQSGTTHSGTGGGAGKASVNDISIVKKVDKSSPILIKSCIQGVHIPKGTLTVRKAGGSQLEYYKIDLEDILISGVQCSGHPGSPTLSESVSLNFRKFKIIYTPQDAKGAAGAGVEYAYDIAANKSA